MSVWDTGKLDTWDAIDHYEPYSDKVDESEDDADFAGGTVTDEGRDPEDQVFGFPDKAESAKMLAAIYSAISTELDRERKAYQELVRSAVRVTTNLSGQVQFQRYTVPANQAIQICREKPLRGDIVIVNFTDPSTVYVGLHEGIMVGGTDSAAIVGSTTGTSRRIRTRRALWAIASAPASIDVQEEFD